MEMTVSEALNLAAEHERAGRLADAEAVYRQVLAAMPNHADALHRLGLLAARAQRHDMAAALFRKAAIQVPHQPTYWWSLADACWMNGDADGAIDALRHVLVLNPTMAQAHYNLALALERAGKPEDAITSCRQAVTLRPDWAEAHNNLGALLMRLGRTGE